MSNGVDTSEIKGNTPEIGLSTVFKQWSDTDRNESKMGENGIAKVLRKLGKLAGIHALYGEEDYKLLIQKYGSDEEIKRKFFPHNFKEMMAGKVRGNLDLPFDIYTLVKKGSMKFILGVCLLYFLLTSGFFALIASEPIAGCMDTDTVNFLAKGFLLISGLGHGIDEEGIKLGVTFLESIFRS